MGLASSKRLQGCGGESGGGSRSTVLWTPQELQGFSKAGWFQEMGLAQGTEKGMAGLGGRSDRDLRDRNSLGVASLGLAHHLISGLKPDGTFQGLGRSGFRLRCS